MLLVEIAAASWPSWRASAFPPEPQVPQLTTCEDAGGRSDTESLGPAEEFTFLVSSTGVVHVCSSASRTACGLWSEKFQLIHKLPARLACVSIGRAI